MKLMSFVGFISANKNLIVFNFRFTKKFLHKILQLAIFLHAKVPTTRSNKIKQYSENISNTKYFDLDQRKKWFPPDCPCSNSYFFFRSLSLSHSLPPSLCVSCFLIILLDYEEMGSTHFSSYFAEYVYIDNSKQ